MGSKHEWKQKSTQTLLFNRKPGHVDKVHATHNIKPTSFPIYQKKYCDCEGRKELAYTMVRLQLILLK
jgi:hypothetical protein